MQATARMASVVSSTLPARRRLIRSVRLLQRRMKTDKLSRTRRVSTGALVTLAGAFYVVGGLATIPVNTVRVARSPSGEVLHMPDGRLMLQPDILGELVANWFAYLCFALMAVCVLWALFRTARASLLRFRTSTQSNA